MFDLGWTEMMLIGIVALIVVGPKELPGLFRTIGHAVGRARGMAREFSRAMEAAADETGMKEIDRTIRAAARPAQFGKAQVRDAIGLNPAAPRPAGVKGRPADRSPLPPVGAPLDAAPLDPGPALQPDGATDALAVQRADQAVRRAEEALRRANEAKRRLAGPDAGDAA